MKEKLNLVSLNKEKLSEKQKAKVLGGGGDPADPGSSRYSCCCGGHGMQNSRRNVRSNLNGR